MRKLNIACINANGKLRQETIDSVLFYCNSVDLLFVNETWLGAGKTIPTHWKQYHIYGQPVENTHRYQMGISLFINPALPITKLYVDTQSSDYYMTCHFNGMKIYCLYLPPNPSLDNKTALQILESIPLGPSTIICGDINARIGRTSGDSRWNTRGPKFAKYIRENNLFNWNAIHQYGIPTRINYLESTNTTETSIVDYFLSCADLPQASLEVKTELAVLGSDHKMMIFSFAWLDHLYNADIDTPTPLRKRWKIKRLLEQSVYDEYITTLQRQLFSKKLHARSLEFLKYLAAMHDPTNITAPCSDTIDTIESLTSDFYDCIYYALDKIVTISDSRPKTWTWFWNKNLQTSANYRQACYTRWRKAVGFAKPLWWSKYKDADAKLKSEVKKARALAFQQFCDTLDANPSDAAPTITRIVQSKTRAKHMFTSPEGPQKAVTIMSNYLEGIYDGKYIPQDKAIPIHLQPPTRAILADTHLNDYDFEYCPFTLSSVKHAFKRLPGKKSPGVDHIISEVLSPVSHILSPILLNLFRASWLTGYTPLNWRISQVVSLFKKGDPLDPSSYRPISLTSVFRKMMEYCLQQQLYDQTPFIDIAQGGFKPFLSSIDQAVCLDEIMHRYHNQYYQYPAVAFLDIQKAYDTVDRDIIWDKLFQHCEPLLLNILKNLFDQVQVQVIGGNYKSSFFSLSTGVLQGSVLSPHLYSIYINSLPQLLRSSTSLTSHISNPLDINCLLFADDVALITSPQNLQQLLDLAEQHSLDLGYRWSPSKCVVLSRPNSTNNIEYKLYNTTLTSVDSFRYLGMYFNYKSLDSQLALNNKKETVSTTMHRIHAIGARTNGFSVPLSVQIYKQFVRPQIEYGICATNFVQNQHAAFERLQDDCLRLIVGGFKNSSVKALRVMLNLPSMVDRWHILNSKYNIRLANLPTDSLITQLTTTNIRNSKLNLIKKKNPIQKLFVESTSTGNPHLILKQIFSNYRKQALIASSEVMIKACRVDLHLDSIFIVPMTRKERRRLLRWRLNWLPGKKSTCYCGGEMSRNHVFECHAIPEPYWENIQRAYNTQNPIDNIIKKLPIKKPKTLEQKTQLITKWQPLWTNLLNILFIVDQICHKEQEAFVDEPDTGQLFYNWLLE